MTNTPDEKPHARGEILTFYSFKGGTGRTMALANVACLIAQRSTTAQVLVVDWDLEAPGLDRYFADLMHGVCGSGKDYDARLNAVPGLIDLLYEIEAQQAALLRKTDGPAKISADILLSRVSIESFIFPTDVARVSLMKAGRFDAEYNRKVGTFAWERFYHNSPDFFASFAEALARKFAFVLIDSRTGITDTAGICTALMPEKLVTVFTPNRQSISGVLSQVREITRYRRHSSDARPLAVFPLPSRIEGTEPIRRKDWRYGSATQGITGYQPAFESLFCEVYGLEKCDLASYFDEVQIQHVAAYSFGEPIATLVESAAEELSLASNFRRFADRLIASPLPWVEPPDKTVAASELLRSKVEKRDLEDKLTRTKTVATRLTLGLTVLTAVLGIFAAIAIPAYQDYTIRAQVTEGMVLTSAVRAAVAETYASTDRFPASNSEAGLAGNGTIAGKYTKAVTVGDHATITVTFSEESSPKIADKHLIYSAALNPERDVIWKCRSDDIPQKYLPASCRTEQTGAAEVGTPVAVFEACVVPQLRGVTKSEKFAQAGGVLCQSGGISSRGSSKSTYVTYNAPPGFDILAPVNIEVVSNINGGHKEVEYIRTGDIVSGARVEISCTSPSKPLGPGASMQIRLVGTIEQKPTAEAAEQIRKSCLVPSH